MLCDALQLVCDAYNESWSSTVSLSVTLEINAQTWATTSTVFGANRAPQAMPSVIVPRKLSG